MDRSQQSSWHNTLRQIQARIANWRGTLLSPASRRIPIQSVNCATPIYWLSHNTIPGKVIKTINHINASFLWSGNTSRNGLHPISWDTITRPIPEGGLAIRDIRTQSKAQFTNLVWRFSINPKTYWASILSQKYLCFSNFRNCNQTQKDSPIWRRMLHLRHHILDHLHWAVGNGESIDALYNQWIPGDLPHRQPHSLPAAHANSTILWVRDLTNLDHVNQPS